MIIQKNKLRILLIFSTLISNTVSSEEYLIKLDSKNLKNPVIEKYEGGDNKTQEPTHKNDEWASYLTQKSCWNDAELIPENSILSCSSLSISKLDVEFPTGSLGVFDLTEINFSNNLLDNIDFLTTLNEVSGDFNFNNNNLTDISGLLNTVYVGGNLNLSNNNITDFSSLSNIRSVGGIISIDSLSGEEIFPTSGNWCDNNTYYKFNTEEYKEASAISCGDEYLAVNNAGWASYLNSIVPLNRHSSILGCSNSATKINEGAYLLGCYEEGAPNPNDVTYPSGRIGVSTFTGLRIYRSDNMINLDFLQGVETISRELEIHSNTKMNNIDGLSNLKTVGYGFTLHSNPLLSNVDGLSSLVSTGYGLTLQSNTLLSDISGLSNLRIVGVANSNGNLSLTSTSIKDYSPLANLEKVSHWIRLDPLEGGEIFPKSGAWCDNEVFFKIYDNEALVEAASQCGVEDVSVISNNKEWEPYLYNKNAGGANCTPLENGKSLKYCYSTLGPDESDYNFPLGNMGVSNLNDMYMHSNPNISNINFFKGLDSIKYFFYLYGNDNLINVDGLSDLTSVGVEFKLNNNSSLTNVDGLSNLISVGTSTVYAGNGHDFNLSYNPNLMNLDGLLNLKTVEEDFMLNSNNSLSEVSGLNNLTKVGEKLMLTSNANLSSVNGFNNLPTVGKSMYLSSNPNLTEIKGFNSLTSVSDGLFLYSNNLQNIEGLSNLVSVGGHLFLNNNINLSDISFLSNLTSISGIFRLQDTNITNYSFLSNLGSVTSTIDMDSLEGGEIFPTSGAWCDNSVYNKIVDETVKAEAASQCL